MMNLDTADRRIRQRVLEAAVSLLSQRGLSGELLRDAATIAGCSFERAQIFNPIQVVHSGDEAVAYLAGEGRFANRDEYPLPALLLLEACGVRDGHHATSLVGSFH